MKKLMIALFAFMPVLASAEGGLTGFLGTVEELFQSFYALILAAAGIAFAWGLLTFIFKGDGDKEKAKGVMIWSITALFLMVSVWGIINIVQSTFIDDGDLNIQHTPKLPGIG